MFRAKLLRGGVRGLDETIFQHVKGESYGSNIMCSEWAYYNKIQKSCFFFFFFFFFFFGGGGDYQYRGSNSYFEYARFYLYIRSFSTGCDALCFSGQRFFRIFHSMISMAIRKVYSFCFERVLEQNVKVFF